MSDSKRIYVSCPGKPAQEMTVPAVASVLTVLRGAVIALGLNTLQMHILLE